jgi:hypothetical protein
MDHKDQLAGIDLRGEGGLGFDFADAEMRGLLFRA